LARDSRSAVNFAILIEDEAATARTLDRRWFAADDNSAEVHPTHYCLIPQFVADDNWAAA
jgi:hypothetical protein